MRLHLVVGITESGDSAHLVFLAAVVLNSDPSGIVLGFHAMEACLVVSVTNFLAVTVRGLWIMQGVRGSIQHRGLWRASW